MNEHVQDVNDSTAPVHLVDGGHLGATVTYACGGWNYWTHLRVVSSRPVTCPECNATGLVPRTDLRRAVPPELPDEKARK